jgi:hypothetical protein
MRTFCLDTLKNYLVVIAALQTFYGVQYLILPVVEELAVKGMFSDPVARAEKLAFLAAFVVIIVLRDLGHYLVRRVTGDWHR